MTEQPSGSQRPAGREAERARPYTYLEILYNQGALDATTVRDLIQHQQRMQRAEMRLQAMGSIFALIVAGSFLGVAGWLINGGHDVAGTFIGTVDIVSLVTAFLIGRRGDGRGSTGDSAADPPSVIHLG
jgi:hypothetical protein